MSEEIKIFGRSWEEIQDMQQGTRVQNQIDARFPQASRADVELLERHGLGGLEDMGFFGVIDRLRNSGIIEVVS